MDDEVWPPPAHPLRDTVLSFIIIVMMLAGILLYISDDPRQLFAYWLRWFILMGFFAIGFMRFISAVRAWATGGLPQMSATTAPSLAAEPDTLAAVKPEDVFGLWANASLVADREGVVIAGDAYRNYERACAINGVQAVTSNRFGTMLTRRAEMSGGEIIKTKANGKMAYRGWSLADNGGAAQEAVM